jgi:hypothetical protein
VGWLTKNSHSFWTYLWGHVNASIKHHLLNVSEAEREGVIQPDAVGDDLGGEAMSFITNAHPLSFTQTGACARAVNLTIPYAERLMRTIKEEEVNLSEYRNYQEVNERMGECLDDVYMHKWIHSALGYLTPGEVEEQWQVAQIAEEMIN